MLLGHYLETRIVCCEKNVDETKMKSGKKEIEKVFSYIVKIDDLSLSCHTVRNWKNVELQRNNITVQ